MIQKYNPDLIILEDIQQQDNVLTFKKLAWLQGVLINYLYERDFNFEVVSPATWRAHSEIKGKDRQSKKRHAQDKVKELYDVSVTQDEADAILIGKWAADNHKQNDLIEF